MPDTKNRSLRVFLCHASDDKPAVRELYRQLCAEGWLDVWLDEEKLLPGQEWDLEIEKAVEAADVVLVCLSTHSVDKEGYIQEELRFVLNIADQKPEGAIFIIPIRLNDCPAPRRLRMWQYVDYYPKDRRKWAYERILQSLKLRAARLGISTVNPAEENAHREADERARQEAEEKARKDKEEQERNAAEEWMRKQAEEKARQERETREIKKAEEQARKAAKRTRSELKKKQPRKFNYIRAIALGASLLCFLIAGVGINYLIKNWPFGSSHAGTDTATPTPGPGDIWTRPTDGMVMVYVPDGKFTMGSDAEDALAECQKYIIDCKRSWFIDGEPPHQIYMDAFWIDQTEVTNAMFQKFMQMENYQTDAKKNGWSWVFNEAGLDQVTGADWSHPKGPNSNISNRGNYPVTNISWSDAQAYCEWLDVRLPTEAEWEKAARGTDGRIYPWGTASPSCLLANYSGCIGDTTAVGSYTSGASPYGVMDTAGNVWEWVADWYSATYYSSSPSSTLGHKWLTSYAFSALPW